MVAIKEVTMSYSGHFSQTSISSEFPPASVKEKQPRHANIFEKRGRLSNTAKTHRQIRFSANTQRNQRYR